MYAEDVIKTVKDIVEKAGYQDVFRVSETVNEIADVMLYQRPEGRVYLATLKNPLFPVSDIQNILYKYGPDRFYFGEGNELQIIFELDDGAEYVIEVGDNNIEGFHCGGEDDEWIGIDGTQSGIFKKVKAALAKYNARNDNPERDRIEAMFTAVLISFEEKDEVDEFTGVEISNVVYEYLDEHPEEKELLIRFADDALSLIIYYDSDFFDAKSVLLKVAEAGLEGELYDYIREEYWDVLKSAYLDRIALARRYIKEMTE